MAGKNPFDDDVDDDIFLQRRDNRPSSVFQKPQNHNPKTGFFAVEDDGNIDDDTFLNHPRAGRSGYMLPQHERISQEERRLHDQRMQLLEEKRRIEESTLQSASRSVGMIHESEQVGISTAEDLVRQGEQLQRTEDKLDDMNDTLHTTQRHLTSIKSVFGQIKNYFSKGQETTPTSAKNLTSPVNEEPPRKTSLSENPRFGGMAARQENPGFRAREDPPPRPFQNNSVDDQLDNHLSDMTLGLGRLKGLARGLGDEIEEQNDMLNRINMKADKVDLRIGSQNKSMNRILKK